jgi:hypothetical protein
MTEREADSKLGFLDSLVGLFRSKPAAVAPAASSGAGGFEALRADFEAALRDLDEKAAECRRQAEVKTGAESSSTRTEAERAAVAERRLEDVRRAIREDIGSAHARLKTGIESSELEALAKYIEEVAAQAEAGKDSHELLPRARFAIAEKLREEAGELAAARVVELLRSQDLSWPDPTHYRESARPEEIERSRRRRLAEVRQSFLAQSLERTAQRLLGVVEVWGSDYPDRGSPLWEETVYEGVAAGIRARLVKEAVEQLRRDQDVIMKRTEAAIGKELAALQQTLRSGVTSFEQANQAVAGSLRALDTIVPELAWEHVRASLA